MKVVLTKEDVQAVVLKHLTDEGIIKEGTLYTAKIEDYRSDYLVVTEFKPEVTKTEEE